MFGFREGGLMKGWAYEGVGLWRCGLGSWSWSEVGLKVVIFLRLGFSKLGCELFIGFGYFSSVARDLD